MYIIPKGKPYVTGVVALAIYLRRNTSPGFKGAPKEAFDAAEEFVEEFEKRNGMAK